MPALDREALNSACRSLYHAAGLNHVLPPLTRDARLRSEQSVRPIICRIGRRDVSFAARLDEARADRNRSPSPDIPVFFDAEIHDEFGRDELCDSDRFELIRAFLLGVKSPIRIEENETTGDLNVYIQLSTHYFVDCGHLCADGVESTSGDICKTVSHALYEHSKAFFPTPQDGLSLWNLRARQELLGEALPPAAILWPRPSRRSDALVAAFRAVAARRTWSARRYARAAMIAIGLAGPLGIAAKYGFEADAAKPLIAVAALPPDAASSTSPRVPADAGVASAKASEALPSSPMPSRRARVASLLEPSDILYNASSLDGSRGDRAIAAAVFIPAPAINFTASVPAQEAQNSIAPQIAQTGSRARGAKISAAASRAKLSSAGPKHSMHFARRGSRIPAPVRFVQHAVGAFASAVKTIAKMPLRLASLVTERRPQH